MISPAVGNRHRRETPILFAIPTPRLALLSGHLLAFRAEFLVAVSDNPTAVAVPGRLFWPGQPETPDHTWSKRFAGVEARWERVDAVGAVPWRPLPSSFVFSPVPFAGLPKTEYLPASFRAGHRPGEERASEKTAVDS